MKFSIFNGLRQEAQPGVSGKCPLCDQETIAKCGEIKIWHWAHKGRRTCDAWWENETEWHRTWKGHFPEGWQEIVHKAENGEKHIADVKTDQGWVIEFQYSYINPEERRSRNAFYPKLAWVVNGTRRKRDMPQFKEALNRSIGVGSNTQIRKMVASECAILREWGSIKAPVFFDFGPGPSLWWLLKCDPEGSAYVAPFARSNFVDIHIGGATQQKSDFESFVIDIGKLISEYESRNKRGF
jgi:hypothetical protein